MRRRHLALAALVAALATLLAVLWGASPRPAPDASSGATGGPVAPLAGLPGGAADQRGPPGEPSPGPVAALPRAATVEPGESAFEGRVLSLGTGAGIAGADLTFSGGGAAASVRTGTGGAFRFVPPRAGAWQLAAASAPGHLPFAPEWGHSPVNLTARPGERLSGLTVWLRPATPMTGEVLDAERRPVPGAEVRLLGAGAGEHALIPLPGRFTAGPDGRFTFAAPDGAVLEASHPGHAPGRARIDFAARVSRRLTIVLAGKAEGAPSRGEVSGRVTGAGAPLPGALVAAWRPRDRAVSPGEEVPAAQATTDADGRFTIRELEAASWLLTAAREGWAPGRARDVRPGATDVAIDLSPGGALSGRVRARGDGGPVAPFTVVVRQRGPGAGRMPPRSATVVDPSGRFAVDGLAPGDAVVQVSSPYHAPSEEIPVRIPEPPAAAEIDVQLTAGGRIPGRVLERGTRRPLPGARVELEGAERGGTMLGAWAEAVAGPDGAFLLPGLPDRPLSLFVSAEGHDARLLSGLQVAEGSTAPPVTIELTPVAEGQDPKVELAGIGAVLEPDGRDALRVRLLVVGGGASEAGLAPGDRVTAVDGRTIAELGGMPGAVERIRGPEDTRVVLTVKRGDGSSTDVWVWRRVIRH